VKAAFRLDLLQGLSPAQQRIRAIAYNRERETLELEFEGYTARIFQHEVNHLNGLRFPDQTTNFDHLHWIDNVSLILKCHIVRNLIGGFRP